MIFFLSVASTATNFVLERQLGLIERSYLAGLFIIIKKKKVESGNYFINQIRCQNARIIIESIAYLHNPHVYTSHYSYGSIVYFFKGNICFFVK